MRRDIEVIYLAEDNTKACVRTMDNYEEDEVTAVLFYGDNGKMVNIQCMDEDTYDSSVLPKYLQRKIDTIRKIRRRYNG